MSETTTVTPKVMAANNSLASPKIMKPMQKAIAGVSSVPTVAYGCEHIQGLFKDNRKLSIQQYNLLLQTIFEKSASLSQVLQSSEAHIGPTYLCLQCPSIHSAEQRDKHYHLKRHAFAMDSKAGHLYCQECSDFIYDPSLEEYRQQRGRRKRKLAAYLSNHEDARLISANSQPIPCRANGLRGLYNMGQTCFMSVIMQSLIHNPFMRSYYLSEGHKSADCEKESCISCALDDMFQEFYSVEKTEGYGAVNMLMGSWMANSSLAGYQQQDAHEYMHFLLNSLHEDNAEQGGEASYHDSNESECECVIHRTFYGKLQSNVTCDKCKNTTTRVDPVMEIPLDIRSQMKKRKLEKAKAESGSGDGEAQPPRDIGIQDCLEHFTGREKLGAQDYVCQKCGGQQSATKQLSIKSLPPCLPIHLKRFEHSGKDSGKKLSAKVKFPLSLDMHPYTSKARVQTKATKSQPPRVADKIRDAARYNLNSVVVHKGGIDSGHYVSFARDGHEWFLFDDSKVVLASEAEVLGAEAYLLFYIAATPPD